MTTRWARLAEAVEARRHALMLSQSELAAQAGISESTVRSIENERREGYRLGTLRELSKALGWTPLSIDLILDGGDPVEADTDDDGEAGDLRTEISHLRDEVAQLRALVLDLTAERG